MTCEMRPATIETYTTTVQNVIPKVAFTGRRPPLHLDPPEHTVYRKALNPLLFPRTSQRLEPSIRAIAREILEPLVVAGRGDICKDYSSALTIRVFAAWMNLDGPDAHALSAIGRAYNIAVQSAQDAIVRDSSLELYKMARDLIQHRRAAPRDPAVDPISALLAARDQGLPLNEELLIGTVRQVLVVGIIAPTIVIGSIAVHLARDPALQSTLARAARALAGRRGGISTFVFALSRICSHPDARRRGRWSSHQHRRAGRIDVRFSKS